MAAKGQRKGSPKAAASAEKKTKRRENSAPVDHSTVEQLKAMGFDAKKARDAVLETGGDVEECVQWLVANC